MCVGIFSTEPRDMSPVDYTRRDVSILEILSQGRDSVSVTLTPEDSPENLRPLIYSAVVLGSFYIKENMKREIKRIEFHLDGPVFGSDKYYIKQAFKKNKVVVIGYQKNKNNRMIKRNSNPRKFTQPEIVVAADVLSNYLFRKHGNELFLDIGCEKSRIIRLNCNGYSAHRHILKQG